MENFPDSLYLDPTMGDAFYSSSVPIIDWPSATVEQLILLVHQPQFREQALSFLNKKRETDKELALTLWNSFKTISLLLGEVTSLYKSLSPEKLTPRDSTRVCNAIALLQCLASHPDTKMVFLNVRVPDYLYPFIQTKENGRPFQFLRLTSLGAIAALVKNDDPIVPKAVHYFLETEMFPMCLRCIELGDVLSQSVATLIVSKILMQEEGLYYCCTSMERFFAVMRVFTGVVERMGNVPSPRLLKNLIQCYLRLSEAPRACDSLGRCLPSEFRSPAFINALRDDPVTMQKLQQLLYNVAAGHWGINPEPAGKVLRAALAMRLDRISS